MVVTIDPVYKDCVKNMYDLDDEPFYKRAIEAVEGFIRSEYGEFPERRTLYTDHAPLCAWAIAKHGLLRVCFHCEPPPYTLAYYTDPELFSLLREYLDVMPILLDPSELRNAVRLKSARGAKYACVWAGHFSLCLSQPGDSVDAVVAEELFGKAQERQAAAPG